MNLIEIYQNQIKISVKIILKFTQSRHLLPDFYFHLGRGERCLVTMPRIEIDFLLVFCRQNKVRVN